MIYISTDSNIEVLQEQKNKNEINELFFHLIEYKFTDEINEYINVKKLSINSCNRKSFKNLTNFNYLTELNIISSNLIDKDLYWIVKFEKLEKLSLESNQIVNIKPLKVLTDLVFLDLNDNKIESIHGLQSLSLVELKLDNNKIKSLSEIEYMVTLKRLSLNNNLVDSLIPIQNLIELKYISYNNNPIPNSIPDFIRKILNQTNNYSIYNDMDNVHDSTLQNSSNTSIGNLIKDKIFERDLTCEIFENEILTFECKSLLFEYFEMTDVNVVHNITFERLFKFVWERIINNEYHDELMHRLNEEILESRFQCFTGKINRLLICLMGFYEDIQILISDNERISNVVINEKNKLNQKMNYSVLQHKLNCEYILINEMKYTPNKIKVWIDAI